MREEKISEIKKARAKRMRKRREEIKGLYKKLDEEKSNINKNIETKKQLIQENKDECYRIKANMDKLKDANGIIKPEYVNAYEEMGKQIIEIRNKNIKLNQEIKELNEMVKTIDNKDFGEIAKETSEEEKSLREKQAQEELMWSAKKKEEEEILKAQEELAWNAKEKEEAELAAKEEAEEAERTAKEIEEWKAEEAKKEEEEAKFAETVKKVSKKLKM